MLPTLHDLKDYAHDCLKTKPPSVHASGKSLSVPEMVSCECDKNYKKCLLSTSEQMILMKLVVTYCTLGDWALKNVK